MHATVAISQRKKLSNKQTEVVNPRQGTVIVKFNILATVHLATYSFLLTRPHTTFSAEQLRVFNICINSIDYYL